MEWVAIVTIVALLQFTFFGIRVGQMRAKHNVPAPETTGDPEFVRMFRIQQNTMEQLVVFIPALWMFALHLNAVWAAGIGAVFVISRFIYYSSYLSDPKTRGRGFGPGFAAIAILTIGALVGVVMDLI